MKKSCSVPATFVVAITAAMMAEGCSCGHDECRDSYGRLLPDSMCQGYGGGGYYGGYSGGHWVHTGGFGGFGSGGYGGG